MTRRLSMIAAAAVAASLMAAPAAEASMLMFTGTATNTNGPPVADGSCSPLLRLSFGPGGTAGTSNLGDFSYTQTHCTTGGPGPYSGGAFEYFFSAGDMLGGIYSGVASPSGTVGLLNNTINLVVTHGTGRFLDGAGTITGVGTVDFRMGAPRQTLALTGSLDLPAVPEPTTWAMLIIGFGAAGSMLRRRAVA